MAEVEKTAPPAKPATKPLWKVEYVKDGGVGIAYFIAPDVARATKRAVKLAKDGETVGSVSYFNEVHP